MSPNDRVTPQWLLLQALEKPGGAAIDELVKSLAADYACHARTVRRLQSRDREIADHINHVEARPHGCACARGCDGTVGDRKCGYGFMK